MKVIIFACVLAMAYSQVQLPNGHDLKQLIDAGFGRLDHNPKDGIVTQAEFDFIIEHDDANNDSCVTEAEYIAVSSAPQEIAVKLFAEFNHGNDDCMDTADMAREFHVIDHNTNGMIDVHEFEKYYTHLLHKLFHGHAVG